MGIRDIVMESDSQIFIYALMGSSDSHMVIANIIEGICQKLYEFRTVLFFSCKETRQSPSSYFGSICQECCFLCNLDRGKLAHG